MINYFGDCRNTKEFLREFLEKRSELRSTQKAASIARDVSKTSSICLQFEYYTHFRI